MKKVAIVADWLIGGGAELVVEQLHELYPEAPIYASYCSKEWQKRLDNKVVTGYLQQWPFSKLRKFLPLLRQRWFESLDLSDYDLVISESGAEAKGVKTDDKTLHINYCNSPTHYYWSRYDAYKKDPGFGPFDFIARFGLSLLINPMRRWDYQAAQRPDHIIADSTHIKNMIKKYYDRESEVIFPPVNTSRFNRESSEKPTERKGFVVTGRQTPYKRIDLAVIACTNLEMPLIVMGGGPEHKKLKKLAGPTIKFLKNPPDSVVTENVRSAEGFIFPGLDDFGISPVEALAAGTPVIAFKGGGALDYVVPGETGEFFQEQTVQSLEACLKSFDSSTFNENSIQSSAEHFSQDAFKHRFSNYINNL